MDYVVAILFGLSTGTLITYSAWPSTKWLQYACAATVLIIGVGIGSFALHVSPVIWLVVTGASLVASLLAGGAIWKDSPLLAICVPSWGRVWFAALHTQMLRRAFRDQAAVRSID